MMTAAALLVLHLALLAPHAPSSPPPPAAGQAEAAVSGTVRDASGQAIAGAVVVLRPASAPERQTAAAADGRFTIASPGGAAVLIVRAGGFAESRQTLGSANP